MRRKELLFYYAMFSIGFLTGKISTIGRHLHGALIDLFTMTTQVLVMLLLAYVIVISLKRAKKMYFGKKE